MLGVRLNEQLEQRLTRLAEVTQRSKSYHAKQALARYIESEELKEQENKIALERWNHYQQTGEKVSPDLVTSWLESWGTDTELECPVK